MPVTLVDRLPLPNLKVYTAGSVVLLSAAVYHAIGVTSDPAWRANMTQQRSEAMAGAEPQLAALDASNSTRNFTEQVADVMTFMLQEPLCMWTVINIAYCSLAIIGFALVRVVFGALRVAEAQRVKDKFWNYLFYKFIFVFGVINVQYMDEVLLWCSWFSLVGFLHLLATLCKDRFEYLSSMAVVGRWAAARLAALVAAVAAGAAALLLLAARLGLPHGKDTFVFMAAECVLVLLSALHVAARCVLQLRGADAAGPLAYYTHLFFDSACLVVETLWVGGQVAWTRAALSLPALVLLLQLRHLLHALARRLARHRHYARLHHHMTVHYPMASRAEVEAHGDCCAICWEPMKEARRLPCRHLFHNSCLCQWVQQDASCPTCRRALHAQPAPPRAAPAPAPPQLPPPRQPPADHFFHFDGSRYVSWLPSFSVEVTRRAPPPHQLDAMARQVQALFPQFPLAALASDVAVTRSAAATVHNILDGRLAPPPPPTPPPSPPPPSSPPPTPEPSPQIAATHTADAATALAESHAHRATSPVPAPAPEPHDHIQFMELKPAAFSLDAMEREKTLRLRKEALIAAARQRYLARHPAAGAAGGAGPSAPRPPPPGAGDPS